MVIKSSKKKAKTQRRAKSKALSSEVEPGSKEMGTTVESMDALTPVMEDLKLDPRGDGMYSGTFRWQESKRFPRLPPYPHTAIQLSKGWDRYLRSRSSNAIDLHQMATQDPSMLDALSFPITLMHAIHQLQLMKPTDSTEKHIVVLGASRKAEQRVWSITDYWYELAYAFPWATVTLWFVGPEVQPDLVTRRPLPANLHVRHLQGTIQTFLQVPKTIPDTPSNTILIGYNCGFGNFVESNDYRLTISWLPDLYAITEMGFPTVFTCANDYADVQGEFAIHTRLTGAHFLLLPQANPFTAASHFHEEGQQETQWSRGNSFLYVIRGHDPIRRTIVQTNDLEQVQRCLQQDQATDLHLVDALGRHLYQQTIVSKEEATRRKLPLPITQNKAATFSPCA